MSLGSAILRPQGLREAPVHGPGRAVDLAVEFIESLMADPQGLREMLSALAETGGDALPAFFQARKEKLRKAEGGLRKILRPVNVLIMGFLSDMGEGIPETLPAALKAMRGFLALARRDSVTYMLRELIRTARSDLDFTPEAVEGLLRDCLEGAATRLQADVQAGDLSAAALKRFEWGLNLRQFMHLVLEELDWPTLDPDLLVDALGTLYDRKGAASALDRFGKLLDAAESLATPIGLLFKAMMERKFSAGGSVGAAADGDPAGVSTTTATAPISWYASWVLRKEARCVIDASTAAIAPIPAVTYNCISPRSMELLAFHSLWITDLAETVLHMISIEQGDIAANSFNMAWDAFNAINTPVNELFIPGWLQWSLVAPLTVLGGLETARCGGADDAVYPIIEILADAAEVALYRKWTWLAREFVLSAVTLSNNDPDAFDAWLKAYAQQQPIGEWLEKQKRLGEPGVSDAEKAALKSRMAALDTPALREQLFTVRQGNHNQFHGLCYGFGEIGAMVLPAILAGHDRAEFGMGKDGPSGAMIGKMFGGTGINLGFRACAMLAGSAMARSFPNDTYGMLFTVLMVGNERMLWNPSDDKEKSVQAARGMWLAGNFILEWIYQAVYLYLFTNAETSGGTYAYIMNSDLPAEGFRFHGFPEDHKTSPYKLPWAKGDKKQCVQNPMGIWNHYPKNGFTYAIDFNHDAGDDVLCSRSGVIVGLVDVNPNNASPKNSLEILFLHAVTGTPKADGAPGFDFPEGALPPVLPPSGLTYQDGTAFEADTRFPPYWDVYGNFWVNLPNQPVPGANGPLALHPSAAALPPATTRGKPWPEDKAFAFLHPGFDRGLMAREYPPGSRFSDGGTLIPSGIVFAPDAPSPPDLDTPMYRKGTTFNPISATFASNPVPAPDPAVAVPGFAPADGDTYLDGVRIPRPLDAAGNPLFFDQAGNPLGFVMPPDCGAKPDWLPRPHPATPLYLPSTRFQPYTTNTNPIPPSGGRNPLLVPGSIFIPAGSFFPPISPLLPLAHTWMVPVVFLFMEYQHGLRNFSRISLSPAATPGQPGGTMTDCYETNALNSILGQYVEQGRVVMLSGDTGTSLFNHLHVQVHADSTIYNRPTLTIPFVYADLEHGIEHGFREGPHGPGVPRAMNWYGSENVRKDFTDPGSLA